MVTGHSRWVSGNAARCRDEIIRLNAEYRTVHGEDYYLYTSRPGDGQTRVVFVDGVVHGYAAGLKHMQNRMTLTTPDHLPASEEEAWRDEPEYESDYPNEQERD